MSSLYLIRANTSTRITNEAGDEHSALQRGFQDNPATARFLGRVWLGWPVRRSYPDHPFCPLREPRSHQGNVRALAVFLAAADAPRRKPGALIERFGKPLRIVTAGALLAARHMAQPFAAPAPRPLPLPEGGGDRNAIPIYNIPNARVVHHFLPDMPIRI